MPDTFTHKNHDFQVELEHDDSVKPPWKEFDCHGVVSNWRPIGSKRAEERILSRDRQSCLFYDWRASVAKAKKEGWRPTHENPRESEFEFNLRVASMKRGEAAHLAVEQDFDRLRDWCDDRWRYVGVVVTDLEHAHKASIWGVESDAHDHIASLMIELAEDILREMKTSESMGENA